MPERKTYHVVRYDGEAKSLFYLMEQGSHDNDADWEIVSSHDSRTEAENVARHLIMVAEMHEPHCPVPRAFARGEGAICLCVNRRQK